MNSRSSEEGFVAAHFDRVNIFIDYATANSQDGLLFHGEVVNAFVS
jgi:hypothetical protein